MTGEGNRTTPLWSTRVGSHAFGTNHAGSDFDNFDCYAIDTYDLLSGRVASGGCHVSESATADGVKVDIQNHEVARWVDGAREENLNYMIGLFSPVVLDDPYGLLAELREIVSANPSTAIVPSTLGMARSNLKKWAMHNASGDEARAIKNLRTSIRAIWFARRFIEGLRGTDLFQNMHDLKTIPTPDLPEYLRFEMELLEENAVRSGLPSHPDAKPFQEYLLRVRLGILCGDPTRYRFAWESVA